MIAVILDTNVVYRDPWLTSEKGQSLLRLAGENKCVVFYPQVVIDELLRQRNEAARDSINSAMEAVSSIGKAGIDVTKLSADLVSIHQSIGEEIDKAFDRLLENPNVEVVPVPVISASRLLQRDLARRRPFTETSVGRKPVSVGFRDTLIWETVLDIARRIPPYSAVLFLSSDQAFQDDGPNVLHPDLVSDLANQESGTDRVNLRPDITPALAMIASLLKDAEGTEHEVSRPVPSQVQQIPNNAEHGDPEAEIAKSIAADEQLAIALSELRSQQPSEVDLVTAATDALYALIQADVSMSMNPSGDYDYPEFAQFSVPGFEDPYIFDIEQTTSFTFSEPPGNPDERIATATATLTIVGALGALEILTGNLEGITILGPLNDHYMEVSSEVSVLAEIKLDVERGEVHFADIVLKDQPTRPRPHPVPLTGSM